jgi:hypothetical protein
MTTDLHAPFPYFGGKSKVAAEVWKRLGDVGNYIEPFFGSGANLLARPSWHAGGTETVNDADGLVANFWRALIADPEQVAFHADWPVNENDLHARHVWLVGQKDSLQANLEGDPEYYDTKVAGWWCWGMCCWIGSGFCSGEGPWQIVDEGQGVNRQLVHLSGQGQGVNRQLVHLSGQGQGVNRKRVRLGGRAEVGVNATDAIYEWMDALANRLRKVRVCCGDWARITGPTPTFGHGLTGVFLDPPYAQTERNATLYRIETEVSTKVREWAIENGNNPLLRIALCGYEGEHSMPDSWYCHSWKASGGYAGQAADKVNMNASRERIWFSPHCLRVEQIPLPMKEME